MQDILNSLSDDMQSRGVTDDAFLGGQLKILQPKIGYRAAMDPVLLAAAAPVLSKGRALDLGAGVGTAGLCYLHRVSNIEMIALEMQEDLSKLSLENARRNDFGALFKAVHGDLSEKYIEGIESNSFDLVITNPPYVDFAKAQHSPDEIRQKANIESHVTMDQWLDVGLKKLKQKGWFVMIQRADRLHEILSHLQGKLGEITIIPLWPKAGEAAKRIIIRGRKAVKGGAVMHPGLCLHEEGRRYTKEAETILWAGQ
ncbi:tRNA1(Val) (adenine(37)-N6)-methyltransferase, partial [Curvivirga aplysinae]|uniref:tRNA1(Val) (adenine(37)-N6)-methyltransferase n=1 Tax=Curvivirga aplysinae TaxID=2529852 RepID=UPI0012BD65EF